MGPTQLDFSRISDCYRDMDPTTIAAFVVAARVCIERRHDSDLFVPVGATHVHNGDETSLVIDWQRPTQDELRTHDNDEDAARDGAYATAFLVARATLDVRVIGRRRAKDGADWIAEIVGTPPERRVLVEVSGLLDGDDTTNPATKRLAVKLKQLRDGNSGWEAIAFVVDFRPPTLKLLSRRIAEASSL
jgi:hypothetical protein